MKKISRNTTLLIASNALNNLLSFILLFVMARTLGDVIYGKYTFALSLAVIFATVADFGLNTYLIREIYMQRAIYNSINLIIWRKLELSFWSSKHYAKFAFISQIKNIVLKILKIRLTLFGKKSRRTDSKF